MQLEDPKVWWWIRLGWRIRRLRPELERIPMKFSANLLVQLAGLIVQAANQVLDLLPPKGKFWASVAVAAAQGVAGVAAHFANPDGSSARKPWSPEEK